MATETCGVGGYNSTGCRYWGQKFSFLSRALFSGIRFGERWLYSESFGFSPLAMAGGYLVQQCWLRGSHPGSLRPLIAGSFTENDTVSFMQLLYFTIFYSVFMKVDFPPVGGDNKAIGFKG